MILLRRGRPEAQAGSSFDIDVTFALAPALLRRRQECFSPWRPPVEVFETDRDLVVRAEIGGLTGDEVEVVVESDELIIRGERAISRPDQPRLYHESRVRYGPFEASVRLLFPVDIPAATADYIDGMLTVRLPRVAPIKVAMRDAGNGELAAPGEQ